MIETIHPTIKSTSNPTIAYQWLQSMPDLVACDFETASIYTDDEKESFKAQLKTETDKQTIIDLTRAINNSGLSHPSQVVITHFSIATSPTTGYVMIFDTPAMERTVMRWLTTTTSTQIWHNLSYDGYIVYDRTGKLPKNYEDTAQLAKSLLNHVDTYKAKVSLKELMGYKYGNWAVSADHFSIDQIHNPDVITYSGVDACATYALYLDIQEELDDTT